MASDLKTRIRNHAAKVEAAMQAEIESMVIEAQQYHINAVRNWQGKPRFVLKPIREKGMVGATLEVTGETKEIWLWVDIGTGEYGPRKSSYYIYPVHAPRLVYRKGYLPKTRPTAKANVGPGVAVGRLASRDFVEHPGIQGREFTKTYVEKLMLPNFKTRIENAVQRVSAL